MKSFVVSAEPVSLLNDVINNLLTNAIKFSYDNGTITVKCYLSQDWKVVEIIDKGMGIPKNLIGKLFDYYKSTSRLGTQGEKGTGFGLPLVKSFMDAYHGCIDVKSTEKGKGEGHGTTFTLKFKNAA
ncbi:MAG: ATP-binding protein [Oligoflexales bacterium]|nr:ATP-binding protein [Oligoflexales bacterium]